MTSPQHHDEATLLWRSVLTLRNNVAVTSWRRDDVEATLLRRFVFVGILLLNKIKKMFGC